MSRMRIFFTSDVHGSEKCFNKYINAGKVYKADVLILGGDVTGKKMAPIIKQPDKSYKVHFLGEDLILKTEEELDKVKKQMKAIGYYAYLTDESEVELLKQDEKKLQEIFTDRMRETIKNWVKFAEERLKGTNIKVYIMPGNDDDYAIDPLLEGHEIVANPNEKIISINGHEMLSLGFSNMTPWKCPRDITEEELKSKIDSLASKIGRMETAIFNIHVPPYGTTIDLAPELDRNLRPIPAGGGGVVMTNVGSKTVREAIKQYQPLIGLHGHVHDSKGMCRIGRTLCFNPGSEYIDGVLRGVIIDIQENKVLDYLFTSG
ncbi:MAG: metallophosphoesterase [Candidatus Bathyarchaeia archaeon]